jgi:hypothetical protein
MNKSAPFYPFASIFVIAVLAQFRGRGDTSGLNPPIAHATEQQQPRQARAKHGVACRRAARSSSRRDQDSLARRVQRPVERCSTYAAA